MNGFVVPDQGGDVTVVIAEAGVNHNGDESTAHLLIDAAAASGAQYVKFQTFDPGLLVAPGTRTAAYQRARAKHDDQGDLLAALVLPDAAWSRLRDHAHEVGVGFLSTPFDVESARLLHDLGVDALKASSGELTNLPYLRHLASLGLPLLISTGMGSAVEVAAAVEACAEAPSLAVFHCVSAYPAPPTECNLRSIPVLAEDLKVAVGWSDHTTGLDTAIIASALGARIFEKHFTLDRTMEGPDHAASLEPDELTQYVSLLSSVPSILGDGLKRRMPSEEGNAPLVRRSWHTSRDLPVGHRLTPRDLIALRPESGISPTENLVGLKVVEALSAGSSLQRHHFGDQE